MVMNIRTILLTLITLFSLEKTVGQTSNKPIKEDSLVASHKFFVRTSYHPLTNWTGPVNIEMYELFGGYKITAKDFIGIKAATWKIFEPMGIQLWDPNLLKESEWFNGRVREYGVGVFYQRMLWKGLYASVEILPLKKVFLDATNNKIAEGFRLYTTYHLGYRISFFKERFFIEPQIHCNYWPINTKGPTGFKEQVEKYDNFFLLEPNLYLGVNF